MLYVWSRFGLLAALVPLLAPGAGQRAQTGLDLSPAETARLEAYHAQIVETSRTLPRRASLAVLVGPVMTLARARSDEGSAIDENRAAILALAAYANGRDLTRLIPEARDWPRPSDRRLVLRNRGDLSQHFTVSAALAASGGAPLANLIGLYKEIQDARSGSGFSFADLAADRAGSAFGDMATLSLESARRLQRRLADARAETDIMPDVDGLPEGLSDEEFTRRFRGDKAADYRRLVDEIDRRIASLAIFGR